MKLIKKQVYVEEGRESNYKEWSLLKDTDKIPESSEDGNDYDYYKYIDLGVVTPEEIIILKKFGVIR